MGACEKEDKLIIFAFTRSGGHFIVKVRTINDTHFGRSLSFYGWKIIVWLCDAQLYELEFVIPVNTEPSAILKAKWYFQYSKFVDLYIVNVILFS